LIVGGFLVRRKRRALA